MSNHKADPKADQEKKDEPEANEHKGGAGDQKKEEGAEAGGGDAAAAAAGAGDKKYAESWEPPTMDVHTPASGDTYAADGNLSINFEVGSKQSDHCKAHFSLHRDGKVITTGVQDEPLKDHHARDVVEMKPDVLGGPGKFELHYWATDKKGVESPIHKVQFEVVDESKQEEKAPAGAAQGGEPGKPAAPG